MNNNIQEIAAELKGRNHYLLLGHAIPDGDCIGSILGLYQGLRLINKKVTMFIYDDIPSIYSYLSDIEKVSNNLPSGEEMENIVFLDCSDQNRINEGIFDRLPKNATIFNIDHHVSNNFFGDYNYVLPLASATAEIVYELLVEMQIPINNVIANSLYAGIVMDTGNFKYNNTTAKTHHIAAELIAKGANLEEARINLFESKPLTEILLLGKALQNLYLSEDGKIAWILLSYNDINELGAKGLHPEGLINYTRMINGVEVGMIFREIEPNLIKIGFRSKRKIDVEAIAAELGGGGHKLSAGAKQEGNLNSVVEKVLQIVQKAVL